MLALGGLTERSVLGQEVREVGPSPTLKGHPEGHGGCESAQPGPGQGSRGAGAAPEGRKVFAGETGERWGSDACRGRRRGWRGPGGAVSRGAAAGRASPPATGTGCSVLGTGGQAWGGQGRGAFGERGLRGLRGPAGGADARVRGWWAVGSRDPEWPALSSASHRELDLEGPVPPSGQAAGPPDVELGGRWWGGVPSFQQVLQTLAEPGLRAAEAQRRDTPGAAFLFSGLPRGHQEGTGLLATPPCGSAWGWGWLDPPRPSPHLPEHLPPAPPSLVPTPLESAQPGPPRPLPHCCPSPVSLPPERRRLWRRRWRG